MLILAQCERHTLSPTSRELSGPCSLFKTACFRTASADRGDSGLPGARWRGLEELAVGVEVLWASSSSESSACCSFSVSCLTSCVIASFQPLKAPQAPHVGF